MILFKQVSFNTVFLPIFHSYADMRRISRTPNHCLILRRKIDFSSRGLCMRTGSTPLLIDERKTHGRILFPKTSTPFFKYVLSSSLKIESSDFVHHTPLFLNIMDLNIVTYKIFVKMFIHILMGLNPFQLFTLNGCKLLLFDLLKYLRIVTVFHVSTEHFLHVLN